MASSGRGRVDQAVPLVSSTRLDSLTDRLTASGSTTREITAPATGEPLGTIPESTPKDVAEAVSTAREVQAGWADVPVGTRAQLIKQFADRVLDRREEFLDVLQAETGKSRQTALEELLDIQSTCEYVAANGPATIAEESRSPAIRWLSTATVTYEPVGVVGVISPWNYPLNLAMVDAIPALLAGNAVVLKPDEKTPYSALLLAELLEAAGLPEGLFQVVAGDGETVGGALIDHVGYVSFTGGTETGRKVAERAGRNLIDCSLELGGNNPLIVLDDADIEQAARGAVGACFPNMGQLCLSAERLYVEKSVYEAFLEAFISETEKLTLGVEHSFNSDLGSLIDEAQLTTVAAHVDDACTRGATIRTGGRARPDVGPYCYEPTILTDVASDSRVACEETFGPVVSVTPVDSEAEAIERANDSPYGLNASVWTGETARGERVARQIECGTVCVNDGFAVGWSATDAPMGGVGASGIGRRHGPEGIRRYTEPRTIAVSRVGPLGLPDRLPTSWVMAGFVGVTRLRRRMKRAIRSVRE